MMQLSWLHFIFERFSMPNANKTGEASINKPPIDADRTLFSAGEILDASGTSHRANSVHNGQTSWKMKTFFDQNEKSIIQSFNWMKS
jgi:hypothetical protein